MLRTIRSPEYLPTAPRSGNIEGAIFRLQNLIKRGRGGLSYWECTVGPEDLSETIATGTLTGTLATTANSKVITGTATLFKTELHLGQFFLIIDATAHRSFLCCVERIVSDLSVRVSYAPAFTVSGKAGHRLPIIFAVDNQRGTALRGNLLRYDNGNLFSVGDGIFRLDGTALSATLGMTRAPQVSILNSGAGTYTHFTLGLPTPAAPTVSSVVLSINAATNASPVELTTSVNHNLLTGAQIAISGGTGAWTAINGTFTITKTSATKFTIPVDSTAFGALAGTVIAGNPKGMQAAKYGIRITTERQATIGHGEGSLVTVLDLAAGAGALIDFGAFNAGIGNDAWGLWATRFVDAADASGKNYINGPWFRVLAGSGQNGQIIAADLNGTKLMTSWLDAEIESNDQLIDGFDNGAPPDAEFVALFNNVPVWISCQGPGDTSPGIRIFPAKPNNIESAPSGLAYPTSPPEIILGVVSANGRLYLLTTNHLEVTVGTGNDNLPVIIQPFWKGGFINPYQVDFANGWIYGCQVSGPSRSVGEGDEQDADRQWAWPITEFTKNWTIGHVLVRHDPLNDAMCYFEAAHSLNSSGFWTTRVWMWGLTENAWVGDLLLTSTTGDMIVSGVATVGNHLEFLCGGRQSNDSVVVKTYRFDTGTGNAIPHYMAAHFYDSGDSMHPKRVGPGVWVSGKITAGSAKVYGAQSSQTIPVSDLETGSNALATRTLSNDGSDIDGARKQVNVKNQKLHSLRIEGTWPGSGDRDRIEDFSYEYSIQGARR